MTTRTLSTRGTPSRAMIWVALGVVYVVWGSTYFAITYVVDEMPPLLSAGVRFVTAALVLGTFLAVRFGVGALRVRLVELRGAAIVGVLLLGGGNGGVMLGQQTVPSGLASLLVAVVPLWVILLRRIGGEHPGWRTWLGVLVGFGGLAVLVLPGGGSGGLTIGVLVIITGAACWSTGSYLSQRMPVPQSPFVATAWEMLFGGLAMLVGGSIAGERVGDLGSYAASAWIGLAYLVVFGSLVAFSAYVWLLEHAPISLVSTYAYVNPVVAVALGAVVLSEAVTPAILVGGAIVLVGVALVVGAERPRQAQAGADGASPVGPGPGAGEPAGDELVAPAAPPERRGPV